MGERRIISGLFRQFMELGGEPARREIGEQLRRGSIFFSYLDAKAERMRIAGSGVLADLHGTKVVFTAAHVLEDFKQQFDDGQMVLSVNRGRGRYIVKPEFQRLSSPGGSSGPDAGVLVFPDSDAATYFNFGGFEPPRASTVKPSFPPMNVECAIAGWPAALAVPTRDESVDSVLLGLDGRFNFLGTTVVELDGTHFWLSAKGPIRVADTDETVELRPGDLGGMSGCGCFFLEADPDLFDPEVQKDVERLKQLAEAGRPALSLYGIHAGTTDDGRLRETPMIHHLRLLARMSNPMRDKVRRLWPTVELRSVAP